MVPQPITVNEKVVESTNNSQESKHPVIKALNDILQAQLLTDVTFKIGKKKLKAHRYILAGKIAEIN